MGAQVNSASAANAGALTRTTRSSRTDRSYLAALTSFGVLAVAASAFDSVARNLALPSIIKTFHLSVGAASDIFGVAFGVTALFNLVVGPITDKVGRKRAVQVVLLAAGLFSGLTAVVQNQWQYAVVASLAGTCLVTISPIEVAVAEEAPKEHRGLIMGIVQGAFSGGALLVGVAGNALLPGGHWRWLFVISFAPLILAVVSQFVLREPKRSMEVQRLRQAGGSSEVVSQLEHPVDVEKALKPNWRQLFDRDVRYQTIVTSIGGLLVNYSTGFVLALSATYFTLYDHLPIANIADSITIESVAALAGSLLVGRLSDLFGAKYPLVIFSLVGAIDIGLIAHHGGVGWMYFTMALFGFSGQGALGCWSRYIADSFPTRVRGTAQGFIQGMFFVGLAYAPIMFGNLMGSGDFVLTCVLGAVIAGAGAIVLAFGRSFPPARELEEIAS